MTTIIAALDKNGVIGKEGKLPWRLKTDMARFRDLTIDQAVIMGRKTYESIPPKFRPLPNRLNIVLSRTLILPPAEGVLIAINLEQALSLIPSELKAFIIGGEEVYKTALPIAKEMILTHVQTEVEDGDAHFPDFEGNGWEMTSRTSVLQNEGDEFPFFFATYKNRS